MSHGSEKRIRDRIVHIRLSAVEHDAVDEAAEQAGLVLSSYARDAMLGAPAPRQVRRPPVERRELARLLAGLGKVGGNLNQLARAANCGTPVARDEILASLADLDVLKEAILHALGRSQ